jgi:hypothetical protein
MTFEKNLDKLLKQGLYLVRANSLPSFMDDNFAVILGAEGKMYRGEGKSLNAALAEALRMFKAKAPWPSLTGEGAMQDFLNDLGIG